MAQKNSKFCKASALSIQSEGPPPGGIETAGGKNSASKYYENRPRRQPFIKK
jgi:hypothetical protein